jgi:hypothetical protein
LFKEVVMEKHYFASTAIGWATAATREGALEKLATGYASDFKPAVANSHKAGEPGIYFWSCEVAAPEDANYAISFFAPKGVPTSNPEECFLTYVTTKKAAFYKEEKDEA